MEINIAIFFPLVVVIIQFVCLLTWCHFERERRKCDGKFSILISMVFDSQKKNYRLKHTFFCLFVKCFIFFLSGVCNRSSHMCVCFNRNQLQWD